LNSDTIGRHVYPPGSVPYGRPIGEWAEEWIKWSLSIPRIDSPILDTSGIKCAVDQKGPVWYLAGTFGTSVRRSCVIPSFKALFFPVIEKECSFAEDGEQIDTEEGLVNRAMYLMDLVTYMKLNIDGVNVKSLRRFRVRSRVFDLIFPENNAYGVRAGLTRSVTDGYWIMLRGLKSGKHVLDFCAEALIPEGPIKSLSKRYVTLKRNKFRTEVRYELTILP
jgi:hypothetical protein